VTTFFLPFYWTIIIEGEKERERIKVQWKYEREIVVIKIVKNGCSYIISHKFIHLKKDKDMHDRCQVW